MSQQKTVPLKIRDWNQTVPAYAYRNQVLAYDDVAGHKGLDLYSQQVCVDLALQEILDNGISVFLAGGTATIAHMSVTKDGIQAVCFRIEQTRDGTRVHTQSGQLLTLPHNRYTLASDIPSGKSATAGRTQCIRDVLQAAGLFAAAR